MKKLVEGSDVVCTKCGKIIPRKEIAEFMNEHYFHTTCWKIVQEIISVEEKNDIRAVKLGNLPDKWLKSDYSGEPTEDRR